MAYLGEEMPKLGFGMMRLPMLSDGSVDLEQTAQMADLMLENGFTYFDTAYGYLDGRSEEAVKAVLVDRHPRGSFLLATKLPAWAGAKSAQEAQEMFWTSLRRTGAGYFDFYLLHNLGGGRTHYFDDYGIWEFLAQRKAEGLIRHLGFSFHDKADVLEGLLEHHPEVEFVQLQINYADWESESVQSRRCYEVARAHGKPVIIMEPVKGGSLAGLPEEVTGPFRRLHPDWSTASWGIRFAASLPGLVTVLSGMSNLDQVRDNLSVMKGFTPLGDEEQQAVAEVRAALDQIPRVPCTECQYCVKGCPQGVDIPGIFKAMNNYLVYQNLTGARGNYSFATREGVRASDCIGCGQCEAACPQHIRIIDELQRSARLFDK
ncbi:aldo/keto reductase [Oscillibacter hominis]|uniref:Aldo/keto reductase n=1 Tax=Oscillibacter hominis TaxID=2763056 RepID=A0A7G9B254_9FIRM|nr:aldo/keto reductase [Oscillibacter hominis]QNL43635.1 aldo/keto reductase [Oscillibacter hominis]